MKERTERNILWVDEEHMSSWTAHFESLELEAIHITKLVRFNNKSVLNGLKGCDAVVIHSGTLNTIPKLKKMLEKIKQTYPEVKIGLQTNTHHPFVEDLVDFYITKPIFPSDLLENLDDALNKS